MDGTRPNSCTIAVEGSATKLYRSDKSQPEGDDSFLHLLMPILARYRQDTTTHDGGSCLGFLFAGLAAADMGFALSKASFLKSNRGEVVIKATYCQTPTVSYSLNTTWKPSRWVYLVRSGGSVEVHDGDMVRPGGHDIGSLSQATAMFVVTPEPTVHASEDAKTLN
jgi:hypothetical protein